MNEIEKAIYFLEEAINRAAKPCGPYAAPNQIGIKECQTAVVALREKLEREKNEPLTLDELRKMDGEPVWIVWPDGRIKSRWWIVGNTDWLMMEFFEPSSEREYGSVWTAYRHPLNGQEPGRKA